MAAPPSELGLAELAREFVSRRVLITGGLGFLGSNLAISLARAGAEVTVADSLLPRYGGNPANLEGFEDRISISYTDARDTYAMAYLVSNHEFIFNFAGQVSHRDSMEDPETDLEINARAPLAILEAVRKNNPEATVIYAGTRQVYGRPRYLPVDEDHPLDPVDANGISNLAGEFYHLLYAQVHGIRAASFRLTNTYGPRQRLWGTTQAFVPIFIRKALLDEPITIYGDGSQKRDFVYVDDSLEGFLRLALTDEAMGSVYNQGHPEPLSLQRFAEILVEIAGKGSITYVPWPDEAQKIDIGDYYGSFERAKLELGWEPRTSLEEGLRRTVEFYKSRLSDYIPENIASPDA